MKSKSDGSRLTSLIMKIAGTFLRLFVVLIFGLISAVVGFIVGSNIFTIFGIELFGREGYESGGPLGFILGGLIGLIAGSVFLFRKRTAN